MINNQAVDCGCDEIPQVLLSTDEALEILTNSASSNSKTHLVALDDALDQILAADISSNINVPGFDNSAMDGYAINLKDEQVNALGGVKFEISDRIPAGSIGRLLEPGYAARIFTGAPVPDGANTIIMQEECELIENDLKIEIYRPISLNENIRPKGNDIKSGEVILKVGTKLRAQDIALAASVGAGEIKVFQKIKVGVFFTGDELIEPGNALKDGQIYNSNRYALVAMLKNLNCEIINLNNVEDTLDATVNALESLKEKCDLIMTTGGVSVGEEDHVKPAVQQLGELNLWRIKMKPGKPLAFGRVGDTAFIGLPGNPVSAMVTFLLFARPFIKKIQGASHYLNTTIKVEANFDWHRSKPRREFVRARLDHTTTPARANQYPKQGSEVLSSMVWADGLIEIPEKTTFKQGEILNFYPLSEMML
ncbi:MAG: molybdopterin molybdotransferase MoeA [Candidatus Thioglobus sp.]|jgi:molybdopterin molybdotransferase|uniref:molybdopterin molybdotransferase MoeA n=1 Tax=Candidatus Thioglobus sp. TaxID=2026721 RepID=UPI0001BD38EE|nr:gephyrin-like molybdotransferase Glp [Candidatus Thioglobus sp.]EEZ79702.1 MAG: molybdopterin biosynthesis protein MoeA [uncultured Candidatus Thioglobus sp.]MBT3186511.1 molybdopterin molybdotransferase MoeA [Candidatus Thioglobus sp.]MBT3431421.1 molybdopterin molybdotransferase MoeA [Candidatus Thioglobus sp.]MBT3965428.1 molybdopterin molybdotransferase MoeA [Candidatus Thioglobus sp.]MBT4316436.1 molybdopterin molybdotransferase MoeA [Candidatus Thioglobus sp.]